MTLTCAQDLVEYSVGAKVCPQCGSTEHYETGSPEHLAAVEAAKPSKAAARKPAGAAKSTGAAEGAE